MANLAGSLLARAMQASGRPGLDLEWIKATLDTAIREVGRPEFSTLVGVLADAQARLHVRLLTTADPRQVSQLTDERLLEMPEVARILGVPEEHARELGRRGELPTVMVGERYVKRFGLRQVDFARLVGVHEISVSRWERDEVRITRPVEQLLRMLAARGAGRGGKR